MRLEEYSFVCDENIHAEVVNFLKVHAKAAYSLHELNLISKPDEIILQTANSLESIVLTHDSDFGKIVFS